MLVDARGRPTPPVEITKRLQQIDPAFHLRFVDSGNGGWWALAQTWRQGDPRYQLVQNGAMHPDDNWDMLCSLPQDCSAEQAYGFLVNTLRMRAPSQEGAREMLNRVHLYNKQTEASVEQEMVEVAEMEADKRLIEKKGKQIFVTR